MLVLGFLIIGFSSVQDAYAAPNCNSAILEANTLYISTETGELYKVETTTGDNCLIGTMLIDPVNNPGGPTIKCKDIAIDHSDPNGQLYCLAGGFDLHTVDRTANFDVGGNDVGPLLGVLIDTNFVGPLTDITANPDEGFNNANSLEIDSAGRAYLAGAGNQAGKLYNLDLTSGDATLRVDFGASRVSSGDLARDESTSNHLYITIQCLLLSGPEVCNDITHDRLFRILLNTPGCPGPCPDTIVALEELNKGNVFAMDIAQPTLNLCYVNIEGFLFETDRDGNEVKSMLLAPNLVAAFGASGNNIGGTMLMINTMSLLIAAGQSNPMWLILLTISGVAVVAYQFKDKIKSKNKKINE